jgi:hypothetical protein
MKGGRTWDVLVRAVAAIRKALPGEKNPEALAILAYFAGAYYNVEELTRLFGREAMIQSSFWQAAWAEGRVEGKGRGSSAKPRIESTKSRDPARPPKAPPASKLVRTRRPPDGA